MPVPWGLLGPKEDQSVGFTFSAARPLGVLTSQVLLLNGLLVGN